MMRWRVLLFCSVTAAAIQAQTVDAIRDVAPRESGINVVILAEGYTEAEAANFRRDAGIKLQALLADESWARFAPVMNGFALFVASAESGASDPSTGTVRDTYFKSSYGTGGIDRLLTIGPDAYATVYALLARFVPEYDVVIVIVNATKYGGSGGSLVVTSLDSAGDDIMLHELGHSFAHLTDEYLDEQLTGTPFEAINGTAHSTRELAPWAKFILPETPVPLSFAEDENTVSLFEGTAYVPKGMYRPTYNSKMRSLYRPFGPVNLRAFADAVHALNLAGAENKPQILQAPASAIVRDRDSWTLAVKAGGPGPITYQWSRNGFYLPNATGASYVISSVTAATAGSYAVEVTNAKGTLVCPEAMVTPLSAARPPSVVVGPAETPAIEGQALFLASTTSGTPPFTYQWSKDGVAIAGATNANLIIKWVTAGDAGSYQVTVSNGLATSTSETIVRVNLPEVTRISNLSIRANVNPVTQPLIVGLVAGGSGTTGTKPLLIRGVGPTLAGIGVPTAMEDPKEELYQGAKKIAENNDWAGDASIATIGHTLGAFDFSSVSSKDAALYLPALGVGTYTVQISGVNGAAGVVLAELYDASPAALFDRTTIRLLNASARAYCGTGNDVAIVGFSISGPDSKRVLVRAIGPTLAAFDVTGVLADPRLQLYADRVKMGENDDWGGTESLRTDFAACGAFALPVGSRDSALVAQLGQGTYSAVISGAGSTTGVVLIEVYELP